MDTELKQKDIYKTSRIMYVLWAAFEYFITIMVSGAYLAKVTTSLGVSDSTTALISSASTFAGAFQIIAIFLAHKTPVKWWVTTLQFIYQMLLSGVYIIALFGFKSNAGLIIFLIIFVAFVIKDIMQPVRQTWFVNMMDNKKIGLISAITVCISLIGGMAFNFGLSKVIDSYEAAGNLKGAFIIITVLISLLTVLNLITMLLSREKKAEGNSHTSALLEVGNLLKNKSYVGFLFASTLLQMSIALISPFLSTYQIGELGFSMTFISIIGIINSSVQAVVIYCLGRFSVNHSLLNVFKLGFLIYPITFLLNVFTVPANGKVMMIIFGLVNVVASASISVGYNYLFTITHENERTAALALRSVFIGTVSFLTTLLATPLFNYIKETCGSVIFGKTIYAQQVLAAISTLICSIATVYIFTRYSKLAKKQRELEKYID